MDSKEFSSLKKKAKGALKSGDMTTLAARVSDIGQDDSKRAVEFVLGLAKVPDGNVYKASVAAIASMRSEEAEKTISGKLARAAGSPFAIMLLVDAMGERADKFAGLQLGAAAASARKAEIQRACISAIKKGKLKSGLSGLIDLLDRIEKNTDDLNVNLIRDTLQKLTGESFETAADWKNFWEPRKDSFDRPMSGGVHKRDGTARRKRPTFFGSEIKSNRLVFVIDTSGSMEAADGMGAGGPTAGPTGGPGAGGAPANPGANSRVRIERAKNQLMNVIDALGPKIRFTIIAYSGVLLMQGGQPVTPPGMSPDGLLPPKIGNLEWRKTWKPKLMAANDKNKADAKQFVGALKAEGGTFTLNGLKAAFEIDGADTIVLLSDGMPNEYDFKNKKQMTPGDILNEIGTMNRVKRRVIDTFGFDAESGSPRGAGGLRGGHRRGSGAGPGGVPAGHGGGGPAGGLGKFMQDLADQNGGDYTQIK